MILKIDCDVYLFYDSRVNETFCHLIEPQGTFTSLGLKKKNNKKKLASHYNVYDGHKNS